MGTLVAGSHGNADIYTKVMVKGNYSPSNHNASRIVDEKGIAPTVMENHGTVTAVQILTYLPVLIYWSLFTFIFIFMPNTKVNIVSGLFAGILSGTIYHILLSLYVSLQIGVTSYNAIYGSFSALPLFLIWLQVSWVIVLFGSELSFFHQNIDAAILAV